VAAALKYFLRQLPDPLLTHALFPSFVRVITLKVDEQLLALRLLCTLLPEANRSLLHDLLNLLGQIADMADDPDGSRMNSRNLALVLSPNLLVLPPETNPGKGKLRKVPSASDESAAADGDSCDVVELMIDLHEHLFVVPPELRDAVLLHHQLVAPSVVNEVLAGLIEAQRTMLARQLPVSRSASPRRSRERRRRSRTRTRRVSDPTNCSHNRRRVSQSLPWRPT
jgi:hypothetical protein